MGTATGVARTAIRSLLLPPLATGCIADFLLSGASHTLRDRTRWRHRAPVRHVKWIGLRIRVHGKTPHEGLIVSNHVSYLDIIALSTVTSCAFVSKKEVAAWPIFGLYARLGGTVFVDRE